MTLASRFTAHRDETADKPRRRLPASLEFVVLLAAAILVAVVVKTFFVQMFFVPSASMRPLFVDNDRILVQKVSYWAGDVKRGDVIVFDDPNGQWLGQEDPQLNVVQKGLKSIGLYPTGGHLVKRVIGVGGDHVVCCDNQGRLRVNGVPLDETDYIRKGAKPSTLDFDIVVPQGRLWVMGDNRGNSEDSRYHQDLDGGTISVKDVVGKVWAVVWPIGHMTLLHRPSTFDNPALDAK